MNGLLWMTIGMSLGIGVSLILGELQLRWESRKQQPYLKPLYNPHGCLQQHFPDDYPKKSCLLSLRLPDGSVRLYPLPYESFNVNLAGTLSLWVTGEGVLDYSKSTSQLGSGMREKTQRFGPTHMLTLGLDGRLIITTFYEGNQLGTSGPVSPDQFMDEIDQQRP